MNQLKTMTDENLVMLYAGGNNAAFDVLLNRHKDSIYSYISFSVRNDDVTEDIFQETFVKAIVTIRQGRYTEAGKFKAWITRIAHNLIIDYFRQGNNVISNDEVENDLFNNIKLCEGTVEDSLVRDQVYSDVKKLIAHLPENQREVLEMRYYQDMSFKEIAEVTGVCINTSLGRMRYALLNLRRMVAENGIELSLPERPA
jgi:RNA polymerase sigma-70 factor (ECF subfamily)